MAAVRHLAPEVVDAREMAVMLGVSKAQMAVILRRPENADIAPRPFRLLDKGVPVYDVNDVKAFIKERKARGL
jgi:hypothetical protein